MNENDDQKPKPGEDGADAHGAVQRRGRRRPLSSSSELDPKRSSGAAGPGKTLPGVAVPGTTLPGTGMPGPPLPGTGMPAATPSGDRRFGAPATAPLGSPSPAKTRATAQGDPAERPPGPGGTQPMPPVGATAVAPPQPVAAATTAEAPKGPSAAPRRGRRRPISSEPAAKVNITDASRDAHEPPKAKGRSWGKFFLITFMVLLALFMVGAGGLYFTLEHVARDLPSVEKLKQGYEPPQITRFVARDGTLLASVFTERRTVIAFDQIPDSAKLAFLAAEDAKFYEHEGLNYLGMLRALSANIRAGRTVQGGSTITQQVVKNVLLGSDRTYRRKIREAMLAQRLEQSLSKDDIFWLYLNHIYLGHGRYGIEEAARYYFGKHASQLVLDEAAALAGIVASPERFSPRKDPDKALSRRAYVLDQMLRKGFITPQLHEQVAKRPLRLAPAEESESQLAPEVVDWVRRELRAHTEQRALAGGHQLKTTIDPRLQAAARKAVRNNLDQYMARHKLVAPFHEKKQALWADPFEGTPKAHGVYTGVVKALDDQTSGIDVQVGDVVGRITLSTEARYNPKGLAPSEFTEVGALLRVSLLEAAEQDQKPPMRLELGPQSALVAMDVRTREVIALVGSYEAVTGGLDRATRARRQPGSTFKPLVYSYALSSRRFTPATMIPVKKSGKGVVEAGNGKYIALRDALAQSNNEAAVALLRQSGPPAVVQWATALGIQSQMQPDLSLALGSYEVTALELCNAYATLASGGMFAEPKGLLEITGPDGRALALPEHPPERRVISAEEAYLATSLMRSVVDGGTGQGAKVLGRPVAGKTGTTNQAKDAWFAGYSTDIVTVVWVGYDDARPLGKREAGSKTALPAWVEFMKAAHEGRPKTNFQRPGGVLELEVDPMTGLLPHPDQEERRKEEFLSGTEPTEMTTFQDAGVPEPGEEGDPTPLPDQADDDEGDEGDPPDDELDPEPPPF